MLFRSAEGKPCGGSGVCQAGTCSPGSSLKPARSCLHIRDSRPGAPSGVYWLDPDEDGPGTPYQVQCEMVLHGGGWLRIDNAWSNVLLDMNNPFITQGFCKLTSTELRAWDGS